VTDIITALLLLLGTGFAFIAGLGIVRMSDVYIRMHAATKAGTLGSGLVLAAVAVHFGDGGVVVRAILTVLFLLITAPVAAHMIGRAAYRTGVPLCKRSKIDEWRLQESAPANHEGNERERPSP
jgi:multicomponent Na+:H+ antiporter subunit G